MPHFVIVVSVGEATLLDEHILEDGGTGDDELVSAVPQVLSDENLDIGGFNLSFNPHSPSAVSLRFYLASPIG